MTKLRCERAVYFVAVRLSPAEKGNTLCGDLLDATGDELECQNWFGKLVLKIGFGFLWSTIDLLRKCYGEGERTLRLDRPAITC